jgi:hypothetical protein
MLFSRFSADMQTLRQRVLASLGGVTVRSSRVGLHGSQGKRLFPMPQEVLDSPYVFALSTGRCGTKLLTQVLSRSPRLRVEHSPKPELEYASTVVHRDGCCTEALKLAILAARFDLFFLDSFRRARIYVETNNRITLFAPGLAELLPYAKFIHLVRDPAGFVRSGMRRDYYKVGVVQHQRLDGSKLAYWNSFSRVEKIAWEWNEINTKIEQFKSAVDIRRVLTIRSESLYGEPSTIPRLFDFIGVENPFCGRPGERALKKLLAHPVNAQKGGAFPPYPEWSESDKEALQRVAQLAEKYGYSYNS